MRLPSSDIAGDRVVLRRRERAMHERQLSLCSAKLSIRSREISDASKLDAVDSTRL